MSFSVVLVRPQIATNTGNIIRLCANAGASLHLIEPLGFDLDAASLRRAGLDYHELTTTTVHPSLDSALASDVRTFACTASAAQAHQEVDYRRGDRFVFGTERSGLAAGDLQRFDLAHRIRIPMRPGNRSLNLANAVAVVVYEAWRQLGFDGQAPHAGTTAETTQD